MAVSVDEDLAAQREEEERRKAALAEQQQQDILEAQQAEEEQQTLERQAQQQSLGNQASNVAKDQAKKWAKRGLWNILAATWEIWVPALLILCGIGLIISVVLMVPIVGCQGPASFSDGAGITAVKLLVASMPGDVCSALTQSNQTPRSGGGGGGGDFWQPDDLVALSGVSIDPGTSDPRVRQCMLGKVQQIYSAATAAGLQVTITSAFRSSDFPSRHAFGEAVDIALRPTPTVPWRTNPQIANLVQIARGAGFVPPTGDTIDEYNNPLERTSGGHVHVEFNRISANGSYCAPYPNPPAPL
jgi:hypothetical protein